MSRPTRAEIENTVKSYQEYGTNASENLRKVVNKIDGWLEEGYNDLEAPALRKQLKRAIELKIDLETQLIELQERLNMATANAAPIIVMPGAFIMVDDRATFDPSLLKRGTPVIFADEPALPAPQKSVDKL